MSILDLLAKGGRAVNRVLDTPVDEALRHPGVQRTGQALGMGAFNGVMGGMLGSIPADNARLSPEEREQLMIRAAIMAAIGGTAGGAMNSMLPAGLSLLGAPLYGAPMSMGMFEPEFQQRPMRYRTSTWDPEQQPQQQGTM